MSELQMRWQMAEPDRDAVAALSAALGLPEIVAVLLVNRGIADPEAASRFLDPRLSDLFDPYALPDVDRAVDRLAAALEKGERIFVHGDYDADGVTSAAICLRALAALGADVVGFVPRRSDGYDLQVRGVEKAKEAGATLLMTADCGICAHEAVRHAADRGIDVIVTDHHRPGETLPPAVAVVNPYRADADPPFRDLCGAGVAFKVLDALVERVQPAHRSAFRRNFLDLVALGTVADVTPLTGENRILVTHGLKALAEGKKTGVKALLISAGLDGKALDTESISFTLGPRLNAAGRMADAEIAYRLLVTRDPDEAEHLAVQIAALAERVREETARATTEALEEALDDPHRVLVLARERWGKGIVGIVAARVAETLRRPTLILSYDGAEDLYHGSGRSWGEFNLLQALNGCEDLLARFGGHSQSAGVSVAAANLAAFRARLHTLAEGLVADESAPPTLEIDAEIATGAAVTCDLLAQLDALAPFGRQNPEPVFLTRGALVLQARRVGKDQNTAQFTLRLPGGESHFKAVRFRSGEWAERYGVGENIDIVYSLKANHWNGRTQIDLMLKDARLSD